MTIEINNLTRSKDHVVSRFKRPPFQKNTLYESAVVFGKHKKCYLPTPIFFSPHQPVPS
jgi:hypothetical protein